MASTSSLITPTNTCRLKICRKPLTPKNIPATNITNLTKKKDTNEKWITCRTSPVEKSADKENQYLTPMDTRRAKICLKQLSPKNIPATNITNLTQDQDINGKWITIPIAEPGDKEDRHFSPTFLSAGNDLQSMKCIVASPMDRNRRSDDKWITISMSGLKGKKKKVAEIEPEKAGAMVNNTIDASLAEELQVIRERDERVQIEKAKTEEMLVARDQVLQRMEEQLQLRWKEQEKLEMELEKLSRLKELQTITIFKPVQSLRERQQAKMQSVPFEAKLEGQEKPVVVEANSC